MNVTAQVLDARQIFLEAVENHAPQQWPAFLDSACQGDAEIRARVEALLEAHGQYNSMLDGEGFVATVDVRVSERPGAQIGPYKLLQQIGEGGFGVVFMAEQTTPVRRKVALKVIKPGMDTRQVIARFEAERQALAVMDHPNIARVLDAGTTDSGRPYFVMELVRGVPITAYCDEHNLPIRDRLTLFAAICQAIQHAHTKGIIHRDIKPTNVLVTRQDGQPVVKVIDFGVAKAMGQQLTEKTLFTEFAQMIGTPLYMSPEQAELSSTDIDTRSDIYSLGVLLYELLTGTTPVDKEQLKKAALDEIRRIIREEDPPKPSTRISTAEAAPSIAAHRHTEPTCLVRLIRGELDWIVMKCLEKDRSRRYESAGALAADLQHYLNDEPVQACPPSAAYRLRKFVRRNKGSLAAALTVAAAVLVLAGVIGWLARDRSARHSRLNERVELALRDADSARRRALMRLDNPREWETGLAAALSALERAEELTLQDQTALELAVLVRIQDLRSALRADEQDRRFIARLDEVLGEVLVWNARRSRSTHEESFLKLKAAFHSQLEWEIGESPVADVAGYVHTRPEPIQQHLLTALDVCLARAPKDSPHAQWLSDVLRTADRDLWRSRARAALAAEDWATLGTLLTEGTASRQPRALVLLYAGHLPTEPFKPRQDVFDRFPPIAHRETWAQERFAVALWLDCLAWQLATQIDPRFWFEDTAPWPSPADRALELSYEAVRRAPNDGDFRNTLGVVQYRVGKWSEAAASLEKAIELSEGGQPSDWLVLAMAQWRLGNHEAARRWYDQAVSGLAKEQSNITDMELKSFRAEAEELLGVNRGD
jgi:serine/threonine protein kinase